MSNKNKNEFIQKAKVELPDEDLNAVAGGGESVTTTEAKIVATDGAVKIKNANGKSVVICTVLGQIVANETLTSDTATISVPSGIVIVTIGDEDAVKVNISQR